MFETLVYAIINAFLLVGYVASVSDTTVSFDGRVVLIQITLEENEDAPPVRPVHLFCHETE